MPAQRPRASFEPIAPDFDLKALVESTTNFTYVDRISCDMIEKQGIEDFERLIALHVIVGGKPLVIEGYDQLLDPWTFSPKWLRDNCGEKVENARNLTSKENLPLTMAHYLNNMGLLANQFFDKPGAYREKQRQRVYLKDIDCPEVWWNKVKVILPLILAYLNESTGESGGPGSVPESNAPGNRLGKGIARAGDLMSSLPPDMRAENLMCYIGHEGTYTPAHREMCASLGHNLMVEASNTVSDDGKAEKPGSSIWFMTESGDRHVVSEYWLSILGHDIEVENHFAQVVAWKKAPFKVYVVEQCPGDLILIPPLAPHQVWNRGTRTMKVAWNRTTVETLEMALNEAIPRSRIVCRDEQYKCKAIVYYTLQKYASLLTLAQQKASRMPAESGHQMLYGKKSKVKQLIKDFKRLFALYRQILLSEMFNPEDRDPKSIEYLPFDSNVTCAYCRCNVFNRFLTCPSCKDLLGHNDDDVDPYDVCLDCYAMGRSCSCISGLKWVEQFKWKELTSKYEAWRVLIIGLDGGQTNKTPLPLADERKRYGKKTLAEVCKEQLKRRPWKDVRKKEEPEPEESDEEIVVGDNGVVKKVVKKKSKTWQKNHHACHVCCKQHEKWKMANCTACDKWFCYGTLFRGMDKMPLQSMEEFNWVCPHCLGVCFAGNCRREGKMKPYEPKGTLLGHDTRKVADVRSTEALVDFSLSNLNWLKDDDIANRVDSGRFRRARAEAEQSKTAQEADDDGEEAPNETQLEYTMVEDEPPIDPALSGISPPNADSRRQLANNSFTTGATDDDGDMAFARRLQEANSSLPPPAAMVAGMPPQPIPEGYTPLASAGYAAPAAQMYPHPEEDTSYQYPSNGHGSESLEPTHEGLRPFKRRKIEQEGNEDIAMSKAKAKRPRLTAAGFRSSDLAEDAIGASASKAKNEAQRQFEKEKERKALDKAKAEGRFIMLQAAIKGKKRIVKLKIPGSRLAQLLAQQAALAALNNTSNGTDQAEAGGVEDADHESIGEDDNSNDVLLKSDVAPKKTRDDLREERREKERSGIIVTGGAKKALIPVEKDENYGYRSRERQSNNKKTGAGTGATENKRRSKRATAVDYEEIDIGSEDESHGPTHAQTNGFVAINGSSRDRRPLPSYLQNRHAEDEETMNELPPVEQQQKRQSFPIEVAEETTSAESQLQAEASSAAAATSNRPKFKPTAGKHPSMRPVQGPKEGNHNNGDTWSGAVTKSPATNGGSRPARRAINTAIRGRGRPSKLLGRNFKPSSPALSSMEEENRLAKLQALNMIDTGESNGSSPKFQGTPVRGTPDRIESGGGGGSGGARLVSMAEAAPQYISSDEGSSSDNDDKGDDDNDDDDDDDDDSIDAVPARRGAAPIIAR